MGAQAKRNFSNIFGGLISNQKAIDGAKEMPWFVAVLFGVIAAFIPVIPTMTAIAKVNGSNFASALNYDQDCATTDCSFQFLKDGYELKFLDGQLRAYKDDVLSLDSTIGKNHTRKFATNPVTGKEYASPISLIELTTVYVDGDASAASTVITSLNDKYYRLDLDFVGQTPKTYEEIKDDTENMYYLPSILCFYRTGLSYFIRPIGRSNVAASSFAGSTWTYTFCPDGMFHRLLTDKAIDPDGEFLSAKFLNSYNSWTDFPSDKIQFAENTFVRLMVVFDESYIEAKNKAMAINTWMYIGVYAGLILLMGVLIFILTRGKKNVFNYLKFWTCMKISMWASLSPAIIALILSFIIPRFAVMSFIILDGIRIMWLCMRQLRPQ
ncbi:MAG: hypothetical protein MJ227_02560 [Bacilli bacterium]|nr:hypothetical protein [Bacilli bacterium]